MNVTKKFKNLNQFRKKDKKAGNFVTFIRLKCALGAPQKNQAIEFPPLRK